MGIVAEAAGAAAGSVLSAGIGVGAQYLQQQNEKDLLQIQNKAQQYAALMTQEDRRRESLRSLESMKATARTIAPFALGLGTIALTAILLRR